MTADTLRDIRTACKRAREHAQQAADTVLGAGGDLAAVESNLRLARVACDAALERVARLRASC
jgi:hypothetical protein